MQFLLGPSALLNPRLNKMMNTQEQNSSRYKILYLITCCLNGSIPKSLRLGSIVWDTPHPCLYFYFDGEVQARDKETIEQIQLSFQSRFLQEPLGNCNLEIIRVDEPNLIDYKGECFFALENSMDVQCSGIE